MNEFADVCYSVRYNMSWADLKRALTRVKKFRKQGLYLVADQNEGSVELIETKTKTNTKARSIVSQNQTFTVRVMGPKKLKSVPIKNRTE